MVQKRPWDLGGVRSPVPGCGGVHWGRVPFWSFCSLACVCKTQAWARPWGPGAWPFGLSSALAHPLHRNGAGFSLPPLGKKDMHPAQAPPQRPTHPPPHPTPQVATPASPAATPTAAPWATFCPPLGTLRATWPFSSRRLPLVSSSQVGRVVWEGYWGRGRPRTRAYRRALPLPQCAGSAWDACGRGWPCLGAPPMTPPPPPFHVYPCMSLHSIHPRRRCAHAPTTTHPPALGRTALKRTLTPSIHASNQLPPFPFPLPPRNKQPAACTTPQNLQRSTPRRPSASSPGPSRPW